MAAVLLPAAVCMTGCKDDSEEDLNVGPSDVTGVFINEVCSSGTDWVELYNSSDQAVSLSGCRLQDSKGAEEEYVFPDGVSIAAHDYLVLEKDTHFAFGISGDGDEIKLLDASYKEIDDIVVPALEDGQTYARATDGGAQWTIMAAGTKGQDNTADPDEQPEPGTSAVNLVINEVMSAPLDGDFDFIEIYNPGMTEVDMSGFILQDEKGESEQYVMPEGTTIAPNGVVLFTQTQAENPNGSFNFGLGSKGDKVVFLDNHGDLIDEVELPAMEDGTSYARTTDGASTWAVTTTPTGGRSNGAADVPSLRGVIVINEVYTFSDQSEINDLDYIELYNASDAAVDLGGLLMWEGGGPEEAWTIPAGKTIPARGYLVIECDKEGLHGDPANYPSWGLSKNDEQIVLADAQQNIIDEVATPNLSEKEAYGRKTDGSSEWVIFAELTPGESNDGTPERQEVVNTSGVYINEIFTNDQDEQTMAWNDSRDFVEFYNATDEDVDLGGFSIYDDKREEDSKYTFPAGTVIAARSFLTLDVYKDNVDGPAFGLGKGGDAIYLYNADGVLVDMMETGDFDDNEIYSTGRRTDGGDEIVVFTEVSKDASNNGKAVK